MQITAPLVKVSENRIQKGESKVVRTHAASILTHVPAAGIATIEWQLGSCSRQAMKWTQPGFSSGWNQVDADTESMLPVQLPVFWLIYEGSRATDRQAAITCHRL